MRDEDLSFKIT